VIVEAPRDAIVEALLRRVAADLAGPAPIPGSPGLRPEELARRSFADLEAVGGEASAFSGRTRAADAPAAATPSPTLIQIYRAETLPRETLDWLAAAARQSERPLRVVAGVTSHRPLVESLAGCGLCIDLVRLPEDIDWPIEAEEPARPPILEIPPQSVRAPILREAPRRPRAAPATVRLAVRRRSMMIGLAALVVLGAFVVSSSSLLTARGFLQSIEVLSVSRGEATQERAPRGAPPLRPERPVVSAQRVATTENAAATVPVDEPGPSVSQARSARRPALAPAHEAVPTREVVARVGEIIDDLLGEDDYGIHRTAIERLVELGPELAGPELLRQINSRRHGTRMSADLREVWIRARGALCEEAAREPRIDSPPELGCPEPPRA
jgi:hypothetical protein